MKQSTLQVLLLVGAATMVGCGDDSGGGNANAGDGGCTNECDPITAPTECVGGDRATYCQEQVTCDPPSTGQWRTVTCETACVNGAQAVPDATELVFEHCGSELTPVDDGDGTCWCRDPHTGNLHQAPLNYGSE